MDQELKALERELTAIEAYVMARGGKAKRVPKHASSRRGEKRQAVLEIISQHPDGLSRGEILNLIGVKGDKSGEQSVSNALSALTKQGSTFSLEGSGGAHVPLSSLPSHSFNIDQRRRPETVFTAMATVSN